MTKGFSLDASSNKSLQRSLDEATLQNDASFNFVVRALATSAMGEAQYFCTADKQKSFFEHYGLAAPLYTHFTSPIRRYADVVVHRQLVAAVERASAPLESSVVDSIASNINVTHRNAKKASEEAQQLFACLFFEGREEKEEAVVTGIRKNALIVFLPKYALKGPLFLKDTQGNLSLPQNAFPKKKKRSTVASSGSFDSKKNTFVFETNNGQFAVSLFDKLTVKMKVFKGRYHLPSLRYELVHFGVSSIEDSASKDTGKVNINKSVLESRQKGIEDFEVRK